MTRDQKRALAWAVMAETSVLLDKWSEKTSHNINLKDVDRSEAARAIAKWFKVMPVEERPANIPSSEDV